MKPQTYRKINKDIISDGFVEEKNLEKLVEKERYNLLYFLKTKSYLILDDCPVLGAFRRILKRSEVEGPYNLPPRLSREDFDSYSEVSREVIKRFFRSEHVPKSFSQIYLLKYCTSEPFVPELIRGIDRNKIIDVGREVSENIQNLYKVRKKRIEHGKINLIAETNGFLVEFHFSDKGYYYPKLFLQVFGKSNPERLLDDLNLHQLGKVFKDEKDQCVEDVLYGGLSLPDFSLDGNGINEILSKNGDRIII